MTIKIIKRGHMGGFLLGGGGIKILSQKGVMCCRARVATAALHAIVFVQHPRDTRVIAAICIGGQ